MSIAITITGSSTEEFQHKLAWAALKFDALPAIEKLSEMRKDFAATEPIAPAQAPEPAPAAIEPVAHVETEPSAEPSSDGPIVSVDAIQKLCTTKSGVVGIEKIKEVIATFGVQFSRDLPEDKRNACYAALQELK